MAADYQIVDQRPVTDVSPSGVFVPAVEITFTTKPSGMTGRVRIPETTYTPDHVDEVVGTAARNIETVQAL
jgi:hypothetical protein